MLEYFTDPITMPLWEIMVCGLIGRAMYEGAKYIIKNRKP